MCATKSQSSHEIPAIILSFLLASHISPRLSWTVLECEVGVHSGRKNFLGSEALVYLIYLTL